MGPEASCCSMGERDALLGVPAAAPSPAARFNLASVDTVRLVGAIHIVVLHHSGLYGKSSMVMWGQSWIDFFFVLSAFGGAHGKIIRGTVPEMGLRRALPRPRTLLRRLAAVYPTYLAAIVLMLATGKTWSGIDRCIEELLLLSAYQPDAMMWPSTGGGMINGVGWYVSAMLVLWLLEEAFVMLGSFCHRRLGPTASFLVPLVWVLVWLAVGKSVIKCPSPLNVLEDTHAHSCY